MNKLFNYIYKTNLAEVLNFISLIKATLKAAGKFLLYGAPVLAIIIAAFEGHIRGYIPVYVFIPIFWYLMLKISNMNRNRKYASRYQQKKQVVKTKPLYKSSDNPRISNSKKEHHKISYDARPKRRFYAAAVALGLAGDVLPTLNQVQTSYKEKMRRAHPDNGGNEALAKSLNNARDLLLQEIKSSSR